ncbi:MAG: glutamine--tRNA ligase, partial [Spirochaetales bacterium]|nr:glutamine--tRNA ligase [Spirochaetales bacterium]
TLIKEDKAYVDSLSAQEIREYRGTLTKPGKDSPYRNRSREENLELFLRIRNGEFEEGAHVLRAKIDMASPNLNMRDPTLYRIRKAHHIRTGDTWCIYPMYDFAHSLSDAIEGITHSLCDISFENHRPLYDWFIENLPVPAAPRQIEFARLNITYTILHKRKLRRLVEEGHVTGWDDPRMPTLSGLRRRGYTPEAIKSFIKAVGLSKVESMVDHALLEYHLREDLNARSPRVMAVLKPLKVVITNWPTGKVEMVPAVNNPEDPASGTRLIPFSKEIYIEQDDFMEDPPKKYFRLSPGREIRLKHAYYIRCDEVIKDPDTGCIRELRCTYDPESRGGMTPDGRKVRGTSHWVSVEHAVPAEVRIYDHLFTKPDPENTGEGEEFIDFFNTDSLTVLTDCRVEPGLRDAKPGTTCQFLRQGYFCPDSKDSSPDHLVFNRTVGMRDTWAKIQKKK